MPPLTIHDLNETATPGPEDVVFDAPLIPGVGKDAPTVVNENGAKQSKTLYRMDLLPPLASLAVAQVLAEGCVKYGKNNWHGIPTDDHLNHALIHLYSYFAGDAQDDHIEHAACRIMMALEIHKMGGPKAGVK